MKKIVSMLLAVCMCLSVGVMLTACGDKEHTHTYKTEWSKDATHHWHACEGEDCTDVADKAEHTWNDGEITTEATAEADGVKTYTCTVCGQTKTEMVEYTVRTTVTKEEWENAFEQLSNVEINVSQDLYGLSEDEWILEQENYRVEDYVITDNGYMRSSEWSDIIYVSHGDTNYQYSIYHKNTNPSWERKIIDQIPSITSSGPIVALFQSESKFNEFSYDEENKMYVASDIKYFDVTDNSELTFKNVFISFENGRITSFSYVAIVSMNNGGTTYTYKQVLEFSFAYGATTLNIPSDYVEKD